MEPTTPSSGLTDPAACETTSQPDQPQHRQQNQQQIHGKGSRPLLWAALLFPDLALERHGTQQAVNDTADKHPLINQAQTSDIQTNSFGSAPNKSDPDVMEPSNPRAIVRMEGAKRLLMSCNAAARATGLHAGLTLNAAYAICPYLAVDDYDETLQQQHVNALCLWAMHYSSWVTPVMPDTVMLEIGSSLALFDGLDNFMQQLQTDIQSQNLTVAMGVAPTPAAARLLSRLCNDSDTAPVCITDKHFLESALQDVPVSALPFDEFTHKGLRQSGIKQCQQLFTLPASSLTRRFGSASTEIVYKLLGRVPDPCPAFDMPEQFSLDIDLPLEAPDTGALQFPLNRLLHALGGYLRATDTGVIQLEIRLFHAKLKASQIVLGFLEATADHRHLLRIATEKMSAVELPAPVVSVKITATQTAAISRAGRDLFNRSQRQSNTIEQAIDLLGARIGREKLYQPCVNDDHRPEHASGTGSLPASAKLSTMARPLWLLPSPQPARQALSIRSRPERIEYGWWDNDDVRRDYYIAKAADGSWLWVFSERRGGQTRGEVQAEYFIHGLFA